MAAYFGQQCEPTLLAWFFRHSVISRDVRMPLY